MDVAGVHLGWQILTVIALVVLVWIALIVDAVIQWRKRRRPFVRQDRAVGLRTGLARITYRGEHRS